MSKTSVKKIDRLESVAIGAGFLLKKLRSQYGKSFGEGMWEQVNHCINDCDQIGRNRLAREEKAKATSQKGGAA